MPVTYSTDRTCPKAFELILIPRGDTIDIECSSQSIDKNSRENYETTAFSERKRIIFTRSCGAYRQEKKRIMYLVFLQIKNNASAVRSLVVLRISETFLLQLRRSLFLSLSSRTVETNVTQEQRQKQNGLSRLKCCSGREKQTNNASSCMQASKLSKMNIFYLTTLSRKIVNISE